MVSNRSKQKSGCGSKIKYGTQTAAVAALISGRRKRFLNKQHWTYLCQNCGGWHIGRRKKKY